MDGLVVLHADDVGDVKVERWQVGDLDFLEYSMRVGVGGDAVLAEQSCDAGIKRLGLSSCGVEHTTTRLVLRELAQRHHRDHRVRRRSESSLTDRSWRWELHTVCCGRARTEARGGRR